MFVEVVIPPPQLKVAPTVEEEAVKTSFIAAQVSCAGGAMPELGAVMF